jgi:hypothetical protein
MPAREKVRNIGVRVRPEFITARDVKKDDTICEGQGLIHEHPMNSCHEIRFLGVHDRQTADQNIYGNIVLFIHERSQIR